MSSHCHLLEEGRNRKTSLFFHRSDVPKRPNMAPENVPGNLTDKFNQNPEFHQRRTPKNPKWNGRSEKTTGEKVE